MSYAATRRSSFTGSASSLGWLKASFVPLCGTQQVRDVGIPALKRWAIVRRRKEKVTLRMQPSAPLPESPVSADSRSGNDIV